MSINDRWQPMQKTKKRRRDPFFVQPLPKSHYFPSRNKYVPDSEAIKAPHRANQQAVQKQTWAELKNMNTNNNTVYTAGMSRQTANTLDSPHQAKCDNTSGQFIEEWPGTERPTSPSACFGETSYQTSAGPDLTSDESNLDLQEAVDRLEFYDRHGRDSSGSVLQKYIERFRKCEPKSREERMKERPSKKQDFWWLHSRAPQGDQDVKGRSLSKHIDIDHGKDKERGVKLTKELLMAMDEATMHLQTKADMLLSKSELSVSSGPIVSTRGLGSSYSASDQSSVSEGPAYRPAFVNIRESGTNELLSKLPRRKDFGDDEGVKPGARPSCGDILAQWRFRRKMEETQGRQFDSGRINKPVGGKNAMDSDMDARLEEFRKRLMSQRCPVTSQDVQFERQRMNMLTGHEEKVPERQISVTVADQQVDPILQRLQGITKQQQFTQQPSHDINVGSSSRNIQESEIAALRDNNTNNSTFRPEKECISKGLSESNQSALDRNNTALLSHTNNIDNTYRPVVDHFSEQVVGDATSKVFNLTQTNTQTLQNRNSNIAHPNAPSDKNENNHLIKKVNVGKIERPLRDLSLNHSQGNVGAGQKTNKKKREGAENSSHDTEFVKSVDVDKSEVNQQAYHQFLEAEKPISEEVGGESSKYSPVVRQAGSKSGSGRAKEMSKLTRNTASYESDSSVASYHALSSKRGRKTDRNKSSRRSKNLHDGDASGTETKSEVSQYSGRESAKDQCSPGKGEKFVTPLQNKSHVRYQKDKRQLNNSMSSSEDVDNYSKFAHNKAADSSQQDNNVDDATDLASNEIDKEESKDRLKDKSTSSETGFKRKEKGKSVETKAKESHQRLAPPTNSPGQPVKRAIGQAVTEHLFDSSTLMSSVDSWASVFPPSPSPPARKLSDVHTPSHKSSAEGRVTSPDCVSGVGDRTSTPKTAATQSSSGDTTPRQPTTDVESSSLTPTQQAVLDMAEGISDDESSSGGEFADDPLLKLLREQRSQYINKLELIEKQLEKTDQAST